MPIDYRKAATLGELPEGTNLFVEVDDQPVALFRIEGQVYAIDDVCTHDGGPLADGKLHGFEIECDRHGARFDIRSGSALSMPAVENVRAHHVKIEGDTIFVAINDTGDLPKEAPPIPASKPAGASSESAETGEKPAGPPVGQDEIVTALKLIRGIMQKYK